MKKIVIITLVLVMALSSVFAAEVPVVKYDDINMTFAPTSARVSGLGDSGIAAAGRLDSYFQNPAALAEGRFGLSVPSVSVTLYNLQKLLSNEASVNHIMNFIKKEEDAQTALLPVAMQMIENLGSGNNEFLTTDVKLGLALGGFGIGINVQEKLHTLADGASTVANVSFVPEVNVGATVALGFRIIDTPNINLDLGASAQFVYKAYMDKVASSDVVSAISGSSMDALVSQLLWNKPTMGGFAIPVNVGVTVGLFGNTFRISATASDINSVYKMKSYSSAGSLVDEVTKGKLTLPNKPDDYAAGDSKSFTITYPWNLTLGVAFVPQIAVLNPVVTADLVDMLNLVSGKEKFAWNKLLLHLNAGAEINLFKYINLRAGINRGYLSVGAGFGVIGIRVEASYSWQEFGVELGDKPVDAFTIRFNLGMDAK